MLKKILISIFFLLAPSLFAQNYTLELHLNNGSVINFPVAEIQKIIFEGVTDIEDAQRIVQAIKTFKVLKNYPNPFNPSTTIEYQLPRNGKVEIRIYNLVGQLVKTLVSENQGAGKHRVKWNGRDKQGNKVASGLYIYQVTFGNERISKKMILVK
ncbi:hypothetical protein Calab_0829 [Caldithrix abyssi DSM 13497]|uniref:Por secretion system C-terminal sorting domain-containing protein n=1 Tax=Caldithrix abyssi DSM 13497 TaxID=880073 RepID=H1XU24_CALAY|nr:FlgD immunoglobulin-like domain containing protein [Caldithrix abyssi]APF16884.1 Por secretion system C-terminal sorting domain-containing protein [Caldithrix abyssi DSM 13497]EHO40467.1 hypothetical protein Calab_0829 [Caldithrix abyssi DSM 13497]